MFYISGGVLGVVDGSVDHIREVAYTYKNISPDVGRASDEEDASARKETAVDESTEPESKDVNHTQDRQRDTDKQKDVYQAKDSPRDTNKHTDTPNSLEEYRKKKVELKATLDKSLEKFRQASSNKDQAAKKKAMDEMTAISKQMFALDDEVKKKHDGVLPDWWEKL
jgi:hypothetical protein